MQNRREEKKYKKKNTRRSLAANCHQTLASRRAHRPGRPYRGRLYLPARLIWGQLYAETGGVQATIRKKLLLFLFLVFFHINPEEVLKFLMSVVSFWGVSWSDATGLDARRSQVPMQSAHNQGEKTPSALRTVEHRLQVNVRWSGKRRHWGSLQARSHQDDHISKKPLQFRARRSKEISEKEETWFQPFIKTNAVDDPTASTFNKSHSWQLQFFGGGDLFLKELSVPTETTWKTHLLDF